MCVCKCTELKLGQVIWTTIGLINFKDKTFQRFRGYLLNHKIKYLGNFLYTCTDEGQLQHVLFCLLSSKTNCAVLKWFRDSCPMTVSVSIIAIAKLSLTQPGPIFTQGVYHLQYRHPQGTMYIRTASDIMPLHELGSDHVSLSKVIIGFSLALAYGAWA